MVSETLRYLLFPDQLSGKFKKYIKKFLAKEFKRLYNTTMTNLIHKPFQLQPEYRTISTSNCGDASWLPAGFCVDEGWDG